MSTASAAVQTSDPPPRPRVVLWTLICACVILLVALAEVNRLTAGAIDPLGASTDLGDLIGPFAFDKHRDWEVWALGQYTLLVADFIQMHFALDLCFIASYFLLLRLVLPPRGVAKLALLVLVAIDVVEDAFLFEASLQLKEGGVATWVANGVSGLAMAKWLFAVIVLLAAFRRARVRSAAWTRIRRAFQGLYHHRLSFSVVIFLAVLMLLPLPDIWDQLPDVQRRWASNTTESWGHLGVAVLVTILIGLQLLLLGRRRSGQAYHAYVTGAHRPDPGPSWWWLTGPVLCVGTWVILSVWGRADLVDGGPFWIAVSVPLLLWGGSWLLHLAHCVRWVVTPRPRDVVRARTTWLVGDVLAILVLFLVGAGLVRAFTAPVALRLATAAAAPTEDLSPFPLQLGLLIAGASISILAFWIANWFLDRLETSRRRVANMLVERLLRPDDDAELPDGWVRRGLIILALGLAVVPLVVAILLPTGFASFLGVVGGLLVVLVSWATIVGFFMIHVQDRQPLEVFRWVQMRSTPVLALIVVLTFVAALNGGDRDLHEVRSSVDAEMPGRETLQTTFDAWLAGSGSCDQTVNIGESARVRPMLVLAAAGGGIRAATWTSLALDELRAAGDCGEVAAVVASGVSGGSVGLALSRYPNASAAVRELAAPDALGAALTGLLVGDLVGGATGLRIPALNTEDRVWLDRAGLMETVLERVSPLDDPWGSEVIGPAGALILNSADAVTGCRVLVSQVDLEPADPEPATTPRVGIPCRRPSGQLPASVDLLARYGAACTPRMSWATAAMLSARFPTVTPAGRVPIATDACGDDPDALHSTRPDDRTFAPAMQLIDGGYAESTAIGTIVDLAPELMRIVRTHNETASTTSPIVVPIFVFLQNSSRADLVEKPPKLSTEAFVPLAGLSARAMQVSTSTLLQRVGDQIADPCPSDRRDETCVKAVAAIRGDLTDGVVVVAPSTEPGIDAPLGYAAFRELLPLLKAVPNSDDRENACEAAARAS